MPDPVVTGLFALGVAIISGILTWILNQARTRLEREKLKLEVENLQAALDRAKTEVQDSRSKKIESDSQELARLKAEFRRQTPGGGWSPYRGLSPRDRERLRRLGIDPYDSRRNRRRVVRKALRQQIPDQDQRRLAIDPDHSRKTRRRVVRKALRQQIPDQDERWRAIDPYDSQDALRLVVRRVVQQQLSDQEQRTMSPETRKLVRNVVMDLQSSEHPNVIARWAGSRRRDRIWVRSGSHTKSSRIKRVTRGKP